MIRANALSKSYGHLKVIDNISVEIESGKLIAIVGPSGAGKSTLLNLLGSLDKPDSGEVFFEGVSYKSLSDKKLAELKNRNIGFVFQFHHLLPEFTALENVAIPSMIAGVSRKKAEEQAAVWLEKVGLEHRLNHKPSELSGGEQQRVAIARALINNPKIVMADEPTGNLDSKNAEQISHLFQTLCSELGITFLIVTHNDSLAAMASKVISLRDGKIV
ncbi:ABC transporter ATP-binding protein [Thermaurantimonas aggregans]|uniref:ABC transporter ATP-binding protein n=1 Tax=Thermaurantimonas aggregans TaxID=2173829 RepID=UPI00157F8834|nr:ABC transporter ATP-binding protein [Thermaurantimonas aggregans]MCX8149078.1 ABC transporter ATP-binding protein [Thermaurantimonas aggregans]